MIVIDTSAIMAMATNEPAQVRCDLVIRQSSRLLMSSGTLTELMVVANGKGFAAEVTTLLDRLDIEYLTVTEIVARRIGEVYRQWGRGFHPAGLTFGDCFAYEAAKSRDCPLLYVGDDFSRTDVMAA